MKVQWEDEDIEFGRLVAQTNKTERMKIGYAYLPGNPEVKVITLNSSADGFVKIFEDKAVLRVYLNQYKYLPIELFDPNVRRGS